MLSPKIDKILIAEPVLGIANSFRSAVASLAPDASIRVSMNQNKMKHILTEWQPVLLIAHMDWLFAEGSCIFDSRQCFEKNIPPFILVVNNAGATQQIFEVVRCGCTEILDQTDDRQAISRAIEAAVCDRWDWGVQVRRAIASKLYCEDPAFSLQKMQAEFEKLAFKLALSIIPSKNGLSKLLGISRQLVQYHLKKREVCSNNLTSESVRNAKP